MAQTGDKAVTVKQLARALGVPSPAPPLPSGYTRLEYIEGTGTQYIDTGVKPDSTMRIKASFDPVSTKDTFIFGARPSWNSSDLFVLLHATSPDSLRDDWGNEKTSVPLSSVPISGTIDVDKNANKTTFNGSYVVTHGESTWSSQYNLYLFACNDGGVARQMTKACVRSFDMWKSGNKVRGLVPACRASDGAVGMYDTVAGAFLVNSGTGAFKAGPEVATATVDGVEDAVVTLKQFSVASSKLGGGGEQPPASPLPSGYTQLEYIEGTGTQYIDTGYFPCELTRVVTAITPTSGNTTNGVFGGRTDNNVSTFSLWCLNGVFRTDFDTNSQHVTTDVRVEAGVRVEVDKDGGTTKLGSKTFKQTGKGFRSANSMYVFAVNPDKSGPRCFHGRIETFSIYESGLLKHELIPARRDSDGVVGMYDTVAGAFLVNSGTGAFKAGPEVGEQPPAGLKETVIYEGSRGGTLYLTRELTAIRKVVVEYREQVNLSYLYTFTYEGEPTGSHTSSNGRVQITFGAVGVSPTLIVEDATGTSLIRFERIIIYEQQ